MRVTPALAAGEQAPGDDGEPGARCALAGRGAVGGARQVASVPGRGQVIRREAEGRRDPHPPKGTLPAVTWEGKENSLILWWIYQNLK